MIGSCFDSDVRFVFAEDSGFIFDAPENQHDSIPLKKKHQTSTQLYPRRPPYFEFESSLFQTTFNTDGFSVTWWSNFSGLWGVVTEVSHSSECWLEVGWKNSDAQHMSKNYSFVDTTFIHFLLCPKRFCWNVLFFFSCFFPWNTSTA